ncbi:formate hydrogenlyase subunit 3/multisubunit Na+/H+ antiporter MnhD subunit [Aliiruegeria haliotis]|uniref:Formate hydrogenlyase subunit 3/multisubunit Na+/H+ antiporter MnhD subunit n=1 Tax=Aliiruegeria haliotis TaxID=1280846 RepID=A0A2T0RLT7_9RHOB|nr:proton-conducting transporter membrane subunit [Aliiruegeria haliotis]PRY22097.1 formate hydrogenlyase subunit 3/multisubunit Na+/H+ antiporter MnhD subunit [Aliiruegeria haliotis]
MIAIPLWLVPAAPLVLLLAFVLPSMRGVARNLVPLAALPALLTATATPGPLSVRLEWLLLGSEFSLSDTGAAFLFFSSLLWGFAGWQALRLLADDRHRDRFFGCFLLAMTGNFGLLVAQDMASFYSFFSMMSLASWGLVLHGGGAPQRFAGRVYITFAVAGEVALFAGLAIGAYFTGSMALPAMASDGVPPLAIALAAGGLLVKLGAVPLHLWLPLAHSAAPAPASAVLSGAMLKAGLFGLMIILPLGETASPAAATALAAMALAGLILAPVLGLVQADAKATLAYSSIGQMSLMALGLAVALAAPESWPFVAAALILLATAHAFAKAALFLGVPAVWASSRGVSRPAIILALCLPALALAGMPGTGGFKAKEALKSAFAAAPEGWAVWLGLALFCASLGTALLMMRALTLLASTAPKPDVPQDVVFPWLALLLFVGIGFSAAPLPFVDAGVVKLPDVLPVALAVGLGLCAMVLCRVSSLRVEPPAPGEILGLLRQQTAPEPVLALPPPRLPRSRNRGLVLRRARTRLVRPESGSLAILGMTAALTFLALLPDAPTGELTGDRTVATTP